MPIPPEPILRAAARWLERVPGSGVDRVRSVLHTNRDLGDITPTQYELGFAWLQSSGLLAVPPTPHVGEQIFETAVTEADWFLDADMHVREPAELPSDARAAADGLGLGEDEAFQSVRRAWARYDDTQRKLIGSAGEEAFVDLLRQVVIGEIDHVAARSDGHGYDIAVTTPSTTCHIEVKSTTRRGRLVVHLSRNEYETMLTDRHWCMVALRLTPDHAIASIATVPHQLLIASAPADVTFTGRWESARFTIPADAVEPGIERLAQGLKGGDGAQLLLGTPGWTDRR